MTGGAVVEERPVRATVTRRLARRARRLLVRRPGVVVAAAVLILVTLWALAPSWFTDQDPIRGTASERLRAPNTRHLFGTDQVGRDIYARVVHGAALSLLGAMIAVSLSLVIGSVVGLLAAYFGRWADSLLMRAIDVLLATPAVLSALAIIAVLGPGVANVAVAVGLASIAGIARVTRATVIRVRTASYVEAARGCGVRWYAVLAGHIVPNSIGPVLALATLEFGGVLLAVSALSFLGFGAAPPTPEWGSMIAAGRDYFATSWWLTTFPGLILVIVVLAVNRLSRLLGEEYEA
ncbi:ABC transporter permease [Kribbella kalugense]|uniref:Peptide/nickel transport system permease protein n=1 Tax=Kribbella kalugense TaxID=2512221 RepID=A0A4R8A1W1_9ACTN|nr:ABC transporter permease [Kribbella kalugense]TDW24185.1 peptide/nickel transport system permease protein [Kribbella kalugense]